MSAAKPRLIRLTVTGHDRKGVVARFASFLFENDVNIEDIDQHVAHDLFVMTMQADVRDCPHSPVKLERELKAVGRGIGMDVHVRPEHQADVKRIAVLVTKEPHVLEQLARDVRRGRIRGRIAIVIGNSRALEPLARKHGLPFIHVPSNDRARSEQRIASLLRRHAADVIVLARYMQILSPSFVFRYQGRIINIHPSLLPAFPGPRAYAQAHDAGVTVAGCTAHFVTTDLDRGPIILQDSFRIDKGRDRLPDLIRRGRALEARVLAEAVRLYCADRLRLRRSKVVWK